MHRVHALLRLYPRMRRPARNKNLRSPHAPTRGLQASLASECWLQDQHAFTPPCLFLNDRARTLASDFFVRRPEKNQPMSGVRLQLSQCVSAEERLKQPT